ncbi:hypothetical protein OG705_17025 [Streptomyces sp. NBC_00838]|uniref:hypothetical protein n=1 Tax=Streptomyces sp. NBC_00838 TaxID=2903680 RepID=UPI003869769F|nr:hypothetical protein OG705_17025 [Streptomyces sp. NBC_00838]
MTPEKTDAPHPRNRATMRRAAVLGSLCALVAAWLLLVNVRGALDDERAFRAAVSCDSGDDCLRTTGARIDRTERVEGKKTASYFLYVTEADGTTSSPRLWGSPSDPPAASTGTRVEVTYWRGQIRYVDFDSARRHTTADPRGGYRPFASFGLAIGVFGAGILWVSYWWARHSRSTLRADPWQVGVPITGAVLLTLPGAGAPWATDSFGSALRLLGLCSLAVLAVCSVAALIVRRRQRGDDTIAMTPSVPTEEQIFAARIVGEVPYATQAFLVAGPTSLFSTPDPTGAAFRRRIPDTLSPVRVRPPYWRDPDHHNYGAKAVVLECEDKGTPVLVVTARTNMPWLLGTLGPPSPGTAPSNSASCAPS